MSSFATIRRYYLIYEKVSQGRKPTFAHLLTCLADNGFEISERTLQRDIERLRCDFGIEITYDKNTNGYYIDANESIKTDVFLRFLNQYIGKHFKNSITTLLISLAKISNCHA